MADCEVHDTDLFVGVGKMAGEDNCSNLWLEIGMLVEQPVEVLQVGVGRRLMD